MIYRIFKMSALFTAGANVDFFQMSFLSTFLSLSHEKIYDSQTRGTILVRKGSIYT